MVLVEFAFFSVVFRSSADLFYVRCVGGWEPVAPLTLSHFSDGETILFGVYTDEYRPFPV